MFLQVKPTNSGFNFHTAEQLFCSQDELFGGWKTAGNGEEKIDVVDGGSRIFINIPKWSTMAFLLV
jgi:hypothetical protein